MAVGVGEPKQNTELELTANFFLTKHTILGYKPVRLYFSIVISDSKCLSGILQPQSRALSASSRCSGRWADHQESGTLLSASSLTRGVSVTLKEGGSVPAEVSWCPKWRDPVPSISQGESYLNVLDHWRSWKEEFEGWALLCR